MSDIKGSVLDTVDAAIVIQISTYLAMLLPPVVIKGAPAPSFASCSQWTAL